MTVDTEQLTSDEGWQLCARRACTIEPWCGDDEHSKGLIRFSRRGQPAWQAKWALRYIAKNLQKWARRRTTAPPNGSDGGHPGPGRPPDAKTPAPPDPQQTPLVPGLGHPWWPSCRRAHQPERSVTCPRPHCPAQLRWQRQQQPFSNSLHDDLC